MIFTPKVKVVASTSCNAMIFEILLNISFASDLLILLWKASLKKKITFPSFADSTSSLIRVPDNLEWLSAN